MQIDSAIFQYINTVSGIQGKIGILLNMENSRVVFLVDFRNTRTVNVIVVI